MFDLSTGIKLHLTLFQRRRQRYMLIHVWKTIQGFVPNSANLVIQQHARLGTRIVPPPYPYRVTPTEQKRNGLINFIAHLVLEQLIYGTLYQLLSILQLNFLTCAAGP
eukprot:sb/3477539/